MGFYANGKKKSIQRANGKVRIWTRIQFSSCYDPTLENGRNEQLAYKEQRE